LLKFNRGSPIGLMNVSGPGGSPDALKPAVEESQAASPAMHTSVTANQMKNDLFLLLLDMLPPF
jgi:hypothetical protein